MSSTALGVGFCFQPTEQELLWLLQLKASGQQLPLQAWEVAERALYGKDSTPWEVLSEQEPWRSCDDSGVDQTKKKMYVLTRLNRVSARKVARTAGFGTWEGQTKGKPVWDYSGQSTIGAVKFLSYGVEKGCESKANGKGHWTMHEYSLAGDSLDGIGSTDWVICRITRDDTKDSNPTKVTRKHKQFEEQENLDGLQPCQEAKRPRKVGEFGNCGVPMVADRGYNGLAPVPQQIYPSFYHQGFVPHQVDHQGCLNRMVGHNPTDYGVPIAVGPHVETSSRAIVIDTGKEQLPIHGSVEGATQNISNLFDSLPPDPLPVLLEVDDDYPPNAACPVPINEWAAKAAEGFESEDLDWGKFSNDVESILEFLHNGDDDYPPKAACPVPNNELAAKAAEGLESEDQDLEEYAKDVDGRAGRGLDLEGISLVHMLTSSHASLYFMFSQLSTPSVCKCSSMETI